MRAVQALREPGDSKMSFRGGGAAGARALAVSSPQAIKPRLLMLAAGAIGLALLVSAARASEPNSTAPAPTTAVPTTAIPATPTKAAASPAAKPAALPSLDELLGVAPARETGQPAVGGDVVRQKLDRLLGQEQAEDDEFKQAVALMDQSSTRLGSGVGEASAVAGDTSTTTQRLQEEALRKLDQLIAKARKNKSQCNSQCQESQQQKQDQQQAQPQQAQASQQEQRSQGREQSQAKLPAGKSPELRPALEAARAAWGNLPDRVRSSLVQGAGDRFSREYQRMTEEYYQRLGEQAE